MAWAFYFDSNRAGSADLSAPLYDRFSAHLIGTATSETIPEPRLSKCWNCGSPNHDLRNCQMRKNHAQIAKARQEFFQAKEAAGLESHHHSTDRIHDASEKTNVALDYLRLFRPGEISPELRRAIGYYPDERDFPWLHNMLDHGYPPAYEKFEDDAKPWEMMERKITGDSTWQAIDLLAVEGGILASLDAADNPTNSDDPIKKVKPDKPPFKRMPLGPKVRYAFYDTSLFNSDILPVCFPATLSDFIAMEDQLQAQNFDMEVESDEGG